MRIKKSENSDVMVPAEVFDRLGIGKDVGYEMLKQGQIPSIKAGKRYLIPRAAFEKMLAAPGERNAA